MGYLNLRQKNKETDNNQFVKLYADEEKKELFGWLNTYEETEASQSKKSFIRQQWCLMSKLDVDLYNIAFFIERQPKPVPSNYKQWAELVKTGPSFEAYINRKSFLYPYQPEEIPDDIAEKVGARVYGIYNSKIKSGSKTLVQITLQTEATKSDGDDTRFKQVNLMATMENDNWFTYTREIILDTPVSFGTFIKNGGIEGLSPDLQLDKGGIGCVVYDVVKSKPEPPDPLTILG